MSIDRFASMIALLSAAAVLTSCAGPSTQDDVCTAYDTLNVELSQGTGFFDNAVFDAAGDLADVAEKYPDTDLSRDATILRQIADASTTSSLEVSQATSTIAGLCGG